MSYASMPEVAVKPLMDASSIASPSATWLVKSEKSTTRVSKPLPPSRGPTPGVTIRSSPLPPWTEPETWRNVSLPSPPLAVPAPSTQSSPTPVDTVSALSACTTSRPSLPVTESADESSTSTDVSSRTGKASWVTPPRSTVSVPPPASTSTKVTS